MLETLINPGYACEGYAVKARQDVQDLLVSLACRPAWQQMLRSNTRWTHCQRQRHGPREIPLPRSSTRPPRSGRPSGKTALSRPFPDSCRPIKTTRGPTKEKARDCGPLIRFRSRKRFGPLRP